MGDWQMISGYSSLEEACKNYCPDDDSNGSIGLALAEACYQQGEIQSLEKDAELSRYMNFIDATKRNKIDPNAVFKNIQKKVKLLKDFGYGCLKRKVGENVEYRNLEVVGEDNPLRIGQVFKSTYYSSLKKLKE